MKSYYHAHESAYQQIKSKGYFGWGNAKTLEDLGDNKTNEYLRSTVSKYIDTPADKKALDLGCGSGTTAFTLAKLGFNVTGLDISQTAIEMAQDLALKQELKIQFQVGDVLQLEKLNTKFDLIYDSHCLHCIVFSEDRCKVFDGVKTSLRDKGIFILDTMIIPEKPFDPTEGFDSLRFDDNYILWHKTKASTDRGVTEVDGQYWCAQRRIYPESKIIDEINCAGFIIVAKYIDTQEVSHPWMLRLVLRAR